MTVEHISNVLGEPASDDADAHTADDFEAFFKDRVDSVRASTMITTFRKPLLHANFTSLCFIEWELLPIEVLHCGNRNL